MTKINLPSEILQKEAFRSLPAKDKDEYIGNLLVKLLQLNPDGVTISQIKEATGLTYSTVWHHLEILSCTAQCNKLSRGNLDVYYPNLDVNHLNDYYKGKVRYSISTVKNNDESFICIQEGRENRSNNYTFCKGVSIPFELIDHVIEELSKVKKSIKK